jgi:hypothetical protein
MSGVMIKATVKSIEDLEKISIDIPEEVKEKAGEKITVYPVKNECTLEDFYYLSKDSREYGFNSYSHHYFSYIKGVKLKEGCLNCHFSFNHVANGLTCSRFPDHVKVSGVHWCGEFKSK